MLFALYKMKKFCIFLLKNLHISKKSSTFVLELKTNSDYCFTYSRLDIVHK